MEWWLRICLKMGAENKTDTTAIHGAAVFTLVLDATDAATNKALIIKEVVNLGDKTKGVIEIGIESAGEAAAGRREVVAEAGA